MLCRPLLIGPCKAGNYDGPSRDVSGLSLSSLRNFQSPHLKLSKTSLLHGVFKPMLELIIDSNNSLLKWSLN